MEERIVQHAIRETVVGHRLIAEFSGRKGEAFFYGYDPVEHVIESKGREKPMPWLIEEAMAKRLTMRRFSSWGEAQDWARLAQGAD